MSERIHKTRFLLKRRNGPFWEYFVNTDKWGSTTFSADLRHAHQFINRGIALTELNGNYEKDPESWPIFKEGTYSIEEIIIIE